jgi:hypothetical protein
MMQIKRLVYAVASVCALASASHASAQAFTADARVVGMGGSPKANIATPMVAPSTPYAVIPAPLGLFQILDNLDRFNPSSDQFDPARAIESASNPLHYTFGRNSGTSDNAQARFMRDLVNVELNRDLRTYQGFHIPGEITGEGLAAPAYGGTIKVRKGSDGSFQGIFIGAGPYLSYATTATFDPRLTDILDNGTRYPNTALQVQNHTEVQLALSIVGGYRARFALPNASRERDGVYVAVNYRYLRGFEYLKPDTNVRFDMDNQALLTVNPATTPIDIASIEGKQGIGRAVDLGVQVARGRWEFGVGVNGIGNQIEWTDLSLKRFTVQNLLTGGDFVETDGPAPFDSLVVELPVVTSGNVGYDDGTNALRASVTRGFNGNSFNGGGERWLGVLAVRAGARYSRGFWDPAVGVGIGRRVGVDVGFYGTHANLQEKQQYSMAVSVRIGRGR